MDSREVALVARKVEGEVEVDILMMWSFGVVRYRSVCLVLAVGGN